MTSQNGKSTKAAVSVNRTTSSTSTSSNSNSQAVSHQKAILYMVLLAIQFGIQPIITRRYTSSTINKSTVLLVQEIIKFVMAYAMLLVSGDASRAMQGKHFQKNTYVCNVGIFASSILYFVTACLIFLVFLCRGCFSS